MVGVRRLLVVVACTLAVPAAAQGARPGIDPGPWDHDVHLYRAWPDGVQERLAVFERSGVPALVRLGDGRLMAAHQWFPENAAAAFDKVAVRFSEDDGASWSAPRPIELAGLPEGLRPPFDPTIVPLPEGRIRLYFTTNTARGPGLPWIGSALSEDGLRFQLEPGTRFAVEGQMTIDCAVARYAGVFHLFVPIQGAAGMGYHATSLDGLGFARLPDVASGGGNWLGAVVVSDGRLRFYGTDPGGLWTATSADGSAWSAPERVAVQGADPGVVEQPDGSRLLLVTGPPRPGTPSARR